MSLPAAIAVTPEIEGRYARRGVLGVGGIGIVELSFDKHLGREIAIKRLKPALSGDTSLGRDATRRFLKEARIGALLEHPNIVPVYELGQRADGGLYYTMKRIRGRTLAEALRGADLPERLAFMPHVIAICNAMAYAHEHGVIHRDLKPDNIMVDAHGEALVVDWGLACEKGADDVQSRALARELEALRKASGTQTVTGAPIGTPAYMPPEQARGELQAIDERSDVYALGAILYELLTGAPPFTGPSALHILRRVLTPAAVDPPEELEPDAPPELAAIALRALAKDPAERYPDAAALAADLVAFQSDDRVAAHAYSRSDLFWRWLRTHRFAVGICALTAVAATVTWWSRGIADAREQSAVIEARSVEHTAQADAILDAARAGPLDPAAATTVAIRLAALPAAAVTRRLVDALGDPTPQVRLVAARALAGRGGVDTVDALLARLDAETDTDVRVALVQALGALGDRRASGPVADAREAAGAGSRLWRLTAAAARQLARVPVPDDAEPAALIAQARLLASVDALEAADALFVRAAAAHPERARLERARVARCLGRLTAARRDLDALLTREPAADAARLERAGLLVEQEEYAAARRDLRRLVEAGGGETEAALRALAWLDFAQGDGRAALRTLGAALARRGAPGPVHADRARLLLALGDVRGAERAAALARVHAGDDLEVRLLSARALMRSGRRRAAVAELEGILALDPTHRAAIGLLTALNAGRGRLAQSVRRDPADPARRVQRATLQHARRGDFRNALADLDAALEQTRDRARVGLYALAVAVEVEGSDAHARRVEALPKTDDRPWTRDLLRVLRGEAPPTVLDGRVAQARPRACERALVVATRARLLGDRITAVDHLAAAARLPDPDDPPCALVRALYRR